jgi:hypothetical protein
MKCVKDDLKIINIGYLIIKKFGHARRSGTQHYDIQHKDTQHYDTSHKNIKRDTQHDDTRYCYAKCHK